MFSEIDSEGHHFQLLNEISEHRKNKNVLEVEEGFYNKPNGPKVPRKTTVGWELNVRWKDGSSDWVPLKDLKVSNPVELAEYALAQGIQEEPAFKWWVPFTFRKRNRIISKIKAKYSRTTHQFAIRIPKSVQDAIRIDKDNSNTYWYDSIQKEMGNVKVAF